MKTLDLAAAKFGQAEGLDKINDLAERRFNHDLARSGAQDCSLATPVW